MSLSAAVHNYRITTLNIYFKINSENERAGRYNYNDEIMLVIIARFFINTLCKT